MENELEIYSLDEIVFEWLRAPLIWRGYFYDTLSKRLLDYANIYLAGEYIEQLPIWIIKFTNVLRQREIYLNIENEWENVINLELTRLNYELTILDFTNFEEDDEDTIN